MLPLAGALAAVEAPIEPVAFATFRPSDFAEATAIGCRAKERTWAPLIPGRKETYAWRTTIYNRTLEQSYYRQYGASLFGITMAKKGWDCMRHYEILSSGTVPFFLDIDKLPPGTMFSFPKELVQQAMSLAGVPSSEAVKAALDNPNHPPLPEIDHTKFDIDAYCSVRDQLLAYTQSRLTTTVMARHVLARTRELTTMGATAPPGGLRILMLTPEEVGYQSAVLAHGLELLLASGSGEVARVDFLTNTNATRKSRLYEDTMRGPVYGGGFSFAGQLPTPQAFLKAGTTIQAIEAQRAAEIRARVSAATAEYDLLIVTNDANTFCEFGEPTPKNGQTAMRCTWNGCVAPMDGRYPLERLQLVNSIARDHPRVVIATVDGSDAIPGIGCHEFPQLERVDIQFAREFGSHPLVLRHRAELRANSAAAPAAAAAPAPAAAAAAAPAAAAAAPAPAAAMPAAAAAAAPQGQLGARRSTGMSLMYSS